MPYVNDDCAVNWNNILHNTLILWMPWAEQLISRAISYIHIVFD